MASNFASVLIGNLPPLSKFNKALERVSFGKNTYTGQTLQWAVLGTDEDSNILLVSDGLLFDLGWWILNTGQAAASVIGESINQELRKHFKDEISSDLIIPFGNRLGFSYVGIEGVDDYDGTYYIFDVEKSIWRLHEDSYQKNRSFVRSEQPYDNEPIYYCGINAQPDGIFGPAVLDAIEAGTSDTGRAFTFDGFDISERYYFSTFIDPYEPAYIKPSIERVFIRPAIVVKPEALGRSSSKTHTDLSKSPFDANKSDSLESLPQSNQKTSTQKPAPSKSTASAAKKPDPASRAAPKTNTESVTSNSVKKSNRIDRILVGICVAAFLLVVFAVAACALYPAFQNAQAPNLDFPSQYVELKARGGKLPKSTSVNFIAETDNNCTVTYSIEYVNNKAKGKIKLSEDKKYYIVRKGLKKGTYNITVIATSTSNITGKSTSKTGLIQVVVK